MKQNDWIIANINNPDFTVSDFKNIGELSLENTQLLPMESYLKSEKITNNNLFKDDSGQFSKNKFKEFYNDQAERFNTFSQDSTLDNYEYGFWDVFQKPSSRVRNPEFSIEKTLNPTHQSTGVIGINQQGERTKSDMELAEAQKIFDWNTKQFKDETPEDNALFKNPFKYIGQIFSSITQPLVLAKYEEDTDEIDPLTGEMVHHKAGENKLNENGEYYFETLGGRSINNKQVLSLGDIITKEDTAINKYDFFDSDDIEKSPTGVIVKNLVSVAPLAFLGPVGTSIYSGFYVGREILKTLPMLYNISTMLSDGETPSMLNNLAGFGQSLTGGTSEYGKNSTFSFENFGNLISDVALQWGQQKFIANGLVKIKNSNKSMMDVAKAKAVSEYEKQAANIINQADKGIMDLKQAKNFTGVDSVSDIKNMLQDDLWANTLVGQKAIQKYMPDIQKAWANKQKLGQDLSLIYMAMISNTDVFQDAIEHGATKTEAAMLSLGSMAGMFAVDKYLGLGEMFFDDEEAAARRLYRQSLRESLSNDVKPVIDRLGSVPTVERESRNTLLNLFNKGKESAAKFIKDYKYDIKDRSLSLLGKSVGEGLEEVSEELNTDLWKSLYEVAGSFGWVSQEDIGAWDNMEERYLMSFLGGSLGGALFGGIEAIKNPKSTSDKNSQKELLHLVKEGKTSEIISELERMKDRGMLGSKELSIKTSGKESGNYFVSADDENISQNDFIFNQMKSAIQQMDKIINGNQLGLNDDQLFERMLLSDIKLMHVKDFLKDSTYMSGYFSEYEKIVQDIYNNEVKIQELQSETDSTKRNSEEYNEELQKLIDKRQQLNELKEEFFKNKSQRYLRKTLFGTNANISGALLPMTYSQYVQLKYGKEEKYLSENQKQESKELYDKYVKTRKQKDFNEAFEAWDEMTKKINPTLTSLNKNELDVWEQARKEFQEFIPTFSSVNYNERVAPLTFDLESKLNKLYVEKTPEYDKPWRSDPSKINKAFDLRLKENPSMSFQVVKDHEDGYWSIHFKTDNPKRKEGDPYSGLSESQKKRLFLAAALVIPEGDYLSTWGELTPGGISGINRFGQEEFVGRNRFIKSGTRKVKRKELVEKLVDSDDTTPLEVGDIVEIYTSEGEKQDNSTFKVVNVRPDDDRYNLENIITGASLTLTKSDVDSKIGKKYKKQISTTEESLSDIEIPIWQKVTGETDEEYEHRDNPMEGETNVEFQKRKELRAKRIEEQAMQRELELLQKLLESDSTIDSNTFRYIVSKIRLRAKDIKRMKLRSFGKGSEFYVRYQEILENLNDDLSNRDEILDQIQSLSVDSNLNLMKEQLNKRGIYIIDVEGITSNEDGVITFTDIIEFLNKNLVIDSDSGKIEVLWDKLTEQLPPVEVEKLKESIESDPILLNDVIDFINIQKYLDGTEYYVSEDEDPIDGIILKGKYEDDLLGEITGPINNTEVLKIISNRILEKYRVGGEDVQIGISKEVIDKNVENIKNSDKEVYNALIDEIQNDKQYSILMELPKKISKVNRPTLKLLKAMSEKLGVNFADIETTLETIYQRFNELPEVSDFRLSDSQIEALENAKNIIELAKSAIIAASGKDSYFNPWNYNKTINEWNKAHKSEIDGEIDELPELDENTANIFLQDLYQYQIEINTWIARARENGINKQKMFREFDNKFEEVKLKFVMENRHKFIVDGVDLLEGFSKKETAKDSVLEFERVLYRNTQKLLASGKTEEDLFKAFEDSINWNSAVSQKTSKLSVNLEELTDYDKFIYLITTMCYNPDNFYSDYKKFVEENKASIAPLSFQKHAIRIIKAQENNSKFINKMLQLFKDKTGYDGVILENTSIVTGIGGAGKTSVVAKGIAQEGAAIGGPTEEQIKNLKKHVSNPKEYTREELLKLILGDQYNSFVEEVKSQKNGSLVKFGSNSSGDTVDISSVKIGTIDNPPKQLIIDEATLFNNAELQLISKFCSANDIQLLLIGDENQNGDMSPGWNLFREHSLAVRVPKLGMSLRETNLWKYQNQDTLQNLEDQLRDTDSVEETKTVNQRLLDSDLKKFKLKYYFKDGQFYGDMIISRDITDQQINSIKFNEDPKNPNVCFVGNTSSEVYKKLKNEGKVFDVKTLQEVQGHEYDYVICDIDWKNILGSNKSDFEKTLNFMQSLYTILTRSRNGTMIVNNGLSEIIEGNSSQSYNAPTVNLDTASIDAFSKYELDWINKYTWNPTKNNNVVKPKVITKEEVIEVPEIESPTISPVVGENEKEEEVDRKVIDVPATKSFPIHIYTNFNYLGINRDEKDKLWYNESDSHRDLGIFLRKGDGNIKENSDKKFYVDKLLDLKSAIIFDKVETGTYNSDIFNIVSRDSLKDAKYYVVREEYNSQIHHLVTEEQDLEELPDGTVIYTLQCRFKDNSGNDCSLTLGILPDPTNIRKDIYRDQIQRKYDKLEDNADNKELREYYNNLLTRNDLFDKQFDDYAANLSAITSEQEINKPDFLQMTGLRDLKFHVRLEEVNSLKSRFDARNGAYVISPIYAGVDDSVPNAGKPFILVSADRSIAPEKLIEEYEKQLDNPDSPMTVRRILLSSMGVSFESLFDYRYKDSFVMTTSGDAEYTFPFDLLPVGVRMYVAMHNFRANLQKISDRIKTKFGENLFNLTKILKEESRLYNEYETTTSTPTTTGFRTWLNNNKNKINNEIKFEDIENIWKFNDHDLKDVKQFRIGYDTRPEPAGVYVRQISDGVNGNYVNPEIIEQWLGTIKKVFEVVLDKLIPADTLGKISDLSQITDYKKLADQEKTWVDALEENKEIEFTLDGEDGVRVVIPNENSIRAIPVILTQVVKNLQRRARPNPDKRFKGYDSDPESKYAVKLKKGKDEDDFEFIKYLDILEGGLGEIGHKTNADIGIYEKSGKFYDYRLINMFNVLFHGAVSLWSSPENRNDFLKDRQSHAAEVLFPDGFFVDPILGGTHESSKKYRIVNIDRKYYAANRAPSGAKAFITFDPVVKKTTERKVIEEESDDEEDLEYTRLDEQFSNLFGDVNWCTESAETKEELIQAARKKINEDNKIYFSPKSPIGNNPTEILNLPSNITDSGDIIRIKDLLQQELKTNIDLKLIEDFNQSGNNFNFKYKNYNVEISMRENSILINSKVSTVVVDDDKLKKVLSGEGFADYLIKKGYMDRSTDISDFSDIEDREFIIEDELNVNDINDPTLKTIINGFINEFKEQLENSEITLQESDLIDCLQNYINECE